MNVRNSFVSVQHNGIEPTLVKLLQCKRPFLFGLSI